MEDYVLEMLWIGSERLLVEALCEREMERCISLSALQQEHVNLCTKTMMSPSSG